MSKGPEKYQAMRFVERSVAGGATDIFTALRYIAPEDQTVIGVHVEIALSMESLEPVATYEHNNIGGVARLVIFKAAQTETTPVSAEDWDALANATLNDADCGDTWAMVPFALSSSGSNTIPGHATNIQLMLSPKTKRKLRREDELRVQLIYTNSGDDTGTIQEITTGTLFALT